MIDIQVRSLILLALAGIVLLLLRRASAAMRHLTLSLTVISLLALPLLRPLASFIVPTVPYSLAILPSPLSSPDNTSGAVPEITNQAKVPAIPLQASRDQSPVSQGVTAGVTDPAPNPGGTGAGLPGPLHVSTIAPVLVLSLWALGAAALLLRSVFGLYRLQHVALRSHQAASVAPLLARQFSVLVSSLGLRQPVSLLLGPAEEPGLSPMTWGLLRPTVLLPAEATAWSEARLRPVLLHELAHVQRRDWAIELITCAVCALYWPNPLVWMLARRLRSESERACDDRVLLAGISPTDYAHHLVEVARTLKAQRGRSLVTPAVAVMMAHHSGVGDRVRAILSGERPRRPATSRAAFVVSAVAALLLLPLAGLRIASAGGPQTADPALQQGQTNLLTFEEFIARTGSYRFPNGVVAQGLYVSGVQPDGFLAAWDRTGSVFYRQPNKPAYRLKTGQLRFGVSLLKLPGMPDRMDETEFKRLTSTRALETEFGVLGGRPASHFGQPGRAIQGDGYSHLSEGCIWEPGPATMAAKVDLYLTTSYGPWQSLGVGSREQGGRSAAPGGGTVTLSPLVTKRGGVDAEVVASVPARFVARDANGRPLWCLRLEPVDAAGRTIGRPIGRPRIAQYNETPAKAKDSAGQGRLRFRFLTDELPFAQVASVRLLARPIQTLYFRDVPTRPTGKQLPLK